MMASASMESPSELPIRQNDTGDPAIPQGNHVHNVSKIHRNLVNHGPRCISRQLYLEWQTLFCYLIGVGRFTGSPLTNDWAEPKDRGGGWLDLHSPWPLRVNSCLRQQMRWIAIM
jgi:hypothetical protein